MLARSMPALALLHLVVRRTACKEAEPSVQLLGKKVYLLATQRYGCSQPPRFHLGSNNGRSATLA